MNKNNPNDLFELTRTEMEEIIKYLAERPAKEVYNLLSFLLGRKPSKLAETQQIETNN